MSQSPSRSAPTHPSPRILFSHPRKPQPQRRVRVGLHSAKTLKVLELIMASVVPPRNSVASSVTSGVNVTNNSARPSFSEQISALGARISRAISRDGSQATATTAYSTETSASTHVGDGLEKLKRLPQAPDADTTCKSCIALRLKFSSSIVLFFSCSLCFLLAAGCCRLDPALRLHGVHGLTLALFRPLFLLHSEVRVPSCARQSVTVRLYVCLTPSRPNIQACQQRHRPRKVNCSYCLSSHSALGAQHLPRTGPPRIFEAQTATGSTQTDLRSSQPESREQRDGGIAETVCLLL